MQKSVTINTLSDVFFHVSVINELGDLRTSHIQSNPLIVIFDSTNTS